MTRPLGRRLGSAVFLQRLVTGMQRRLLSRVKTHSLKLVTDRLSDADRSRPVRFFIHATPAKK